MARTGRSGIDGRRISFVGAAMARLGIMGAGITRLGMAPGMTWAGMTRAGMGTAGAGAATVGPGCGLTACGLVEAAGIAGFTVGGFGAAGAGLLAACLAADTGLGAAACVTAGFGPTDFDGADLDGAGFAGADFDATGLVAAALTGDFAADLTGAGVTDFGLAATAVGTFRVGAAGFVLTLMSAFRSCFAAGAVVFGLVMAFFVGVVAALRAGGFTCVFTGVFPGVFPGAFALVVAFVGLAGVAPARGRRVPEDAADPFMKFNPSMVLCQAVKLPGDPRPPRNAHRPCGGPNAPGVEKIAHGQWLRPAMPVACLRSYPYF
jgi:hypothetical protein